MSRLPASPYIPRPMAPPMTIEEAVAAIEHIKARIAHFMAENKAAYTVTIHMAGGVIQQVDAPAGIDVIVIDQDEEQQQ